MAAATAALFSLALFPPIYLVQRVLSADVLLALTDRVLDDRNHANRCAIRPARGPVCNIEIPVKPGRAIDETRVDDCSRWGPKIEQTIRRAYLDLPFANEVYDLVHESITGMPSPWLTDYLMHSLVMTLSRLGWNKEIARGDSVQRHHYYADYECPLYEEQSDYLHELCEQHRCKRLIVDSWVNDDVRKRLAQSGIAIISPQHWRGSAFLSRSDSILDAMARFSVSAIRQQLSATE